jgi:hypothetical protein
MRPYLKKKKNPLQKRPYGVAQSVGFEFKLQYNNNNKKISLGVHNGGSIENWHVIQM